jgi:beta-glucosidase
MILVCSCSVVLLLVLDHVVAVTQLNRGLSTSSPHKSPARQQAEQLVAQMTFGEKVSLLHGTAGPYAGQTAAIPRLGIPPITMQDGPQGVADGAFGATEFPGTLTVAASFDPASAKAFGAAMGKEQRDKGTVVLLGPMVNLARVPLGGRNFESTGEDPVLASRIGAAIIQGIQSAGIAACIKHMVFNNQELNRTLTAAIVDERAAHELYYKPFRAAVDVGVLTAMCSYNRIGLNGTLKYACEHPETLAELKRAPFEGLLMSDWGATHSAGPALLAGLDQEMPFGLFFNTFLLNNPSLADRIDDAAARALTVLISLNMLKQPLTGNLRVDARSAAHDTLSRNLAEDGTVLLKNANGILPTSFESASHIAVIGDDCHKTAAKHSSGGGSGHVCCNNVTTPLQGIVARAQRANVVYLDSSTPLPQIQAAARMADVTMVCVVAWSGEGTDRTSTRLSPADELMIQAVGNATTESVVVLHSTGSVDTSPWIDSISSLVAAFMPGRADGEALARFVFNDISVGGGRLPVTFASQLPFNDTPRQYPGVNNVAEYSEGLFIGYRWFNQYAPKAVQFPFGFGLSYTSFGYSQFSVSKIAPDTLLIAFIVTNRGIYLPGDDVPQVYVKYPAGLGEPEWQLLTFERMRGMRAVEQRWFNHTVTVSSQINVYNVATQQFETPAGSYCFQASMSAADRSSCPAQCIQLP